MVNANTTLTGSGTVLLSGTGGPVQIEAFSGEKVLINEYDTITGTGYIGGNSPGTPGLLVLVNEAKGTILAGSDNTIIIDPNASYVSDNVGVIEAGNGGYVWLAGAQTPIDNDGGAIVAAGSGPNSGPNSAGVTGSSSIVELSSVDLTYGALTASNGGVLLFDTASVVTDAIISLSGDNSQVNVGLSSNGNLTPDVTFNAVTFTGDGSPTGQGVWIYGSGGNNPTTFENVSFRGGVAVNLVGASVKVIGTLTNTGTLSFDDSNNPGGNATAMYISDVVTLTGSGTISLFNNNGGTPQHQIDGYPPDPSGTAELVNLNNTITGTGYIGGNSPGTPGLVYFYNDTDGTIQAGSGDALVINPDANRGVVNAGRIETGNGGYLWFVGASNTSNGITPINNTGGSIVAAGSGANSGFGPSAGVTGSSSIVELSTVNLSSGALTASNGGVLLFDTESVVTGAAVSLSGDNSQVDVGLLSNSLTPDVTFNAVNFTATGGSMGQGVWVSGSGGNGPTLFYKVSFLDGVAVNLVGANVQVGGTASTPVSSTLTNTGTLSFDDPNHPSGNPSCMVISGKVTLTGSGTVSLLNNNGGTPQHKLDGNPNDPSGADELVNLNNTIAGTGYIGGNIPGTPGALNGVSGLLYLYNEATIQAGSGDALVINPDANRGVVNTGSIQAGNGGYIWLVGTENSASTGVTPINNTGGSIVAAGSGANSGFGPSAGVTGSASIVELSSVDLTSGALTASNGGVLIFDTGSVINNAAVSLSGDNSQVDVGSLSNSLTPDVTFNAVNFTATGGSMGQGVWVSGSGGNGPTLFYKVSFLDGVAVNLVGASVQVGGTATTPVSSTLTNTGTLSFDDPNNLSGNPSYMVISGTVTLTGSGTVSLLNNNGGTPQHNIDGNPNDPSGADELVNLNNTIAGTGYIGGNNPGTPGALNGVPGRLYLYNEATIQAGSGDALVINPDANRGVVNTGSIQAGNGGYIWLVGAENSGSNGITPINNTAGSIVAAGSGANSGFGPSAGVTGSASIVELSSVDLTGGALTASNGGVLIFDTGSVINNAAVSLSGDNSQVDVGSLSNSLTPDVTFNTVSFSATGGSTGQGVWVSGAGSTTLANVSFANHVAVNLVGANVLVSGTAATPVASTLTNTGTLSFDDPNNPSGDPSYMVISGTVSLTGSGAFDLVNNNSGSPQHQIDGNPSDPANSDELVNVNNAITGAGYLGGNQPGIPGQLSGTPGLLYLNNEASIQANSDDTLVIDPNADRGIVNTGSIQAGNGGYIWLVGAENSGSNGITPINNTAGSIVAAGSGVNSGFGPSAGVTGSASIVELSSVDLTSGTLTAFNGGVLIFDTGSVINNATVSLSGDNSRVSVGVSSTSNAIISGVTFNTVTFTATGGSMGQGVWVSGTGVNDLTTFNQVSFLDYLAVNLMGADVGVTGTLTNTGTLSFVAPNAPGNLKGQASTMAISGTVAFTGSGTVNLVNSGGSTPVQVIDGNYAAFNPGKPNVLTNLNNTITGTGFIGGTPVGSGSFTSAMEFINHGMVLASSSDNLTLVAGPTFDGATPFPVQNDGAIEIVPGGLMGVVGNYSQNATGILDVELGGTTSASLATLGSANTYSHLDVSGTASLSGTFQVSLANGFVPALGDVFSVVNYGSDTGQFANYLGLHFAGNLELEPAYNSNDMTLTVIAVPEPDTWVVFGLATVILSVCRRRR